MFGADVSTNLIAFICWIVVSLMCFVRKLEKYAVGHNFANGIILSTVVVVTAFASISINQEGSRLSTVPAFNPISW
jgi:hypothetical protein